MENLNVIVDLWAHNGANKCTKYDEFWNQCNRFLNEDMGVAVDDRRHGQITHLARAISIRDFVSQVTSQCPEGTPIPSVEWVRLQFWPKTPSLQHTG